MNVLIILVPFAILIGVFFLACFIYAVKSGQYDDFETPALKIFLNDIDNNKNEDENESSDVTV